MATEAEKIEHTPGPWAHNGDQVEVQAKHNDGYRICDVFGPDYKANARLIAAAPDLLDALKSLDGIVMNPAGSIAVSRAIDNMRAAISKAEGRS